MSSIRSNTAMFRVLKRDFNLDRKDEIFFECWQCGCSVSEEVEQCPECGSEEIVRYEL